jgi:diguanylate cyclase (GGDEF)-like protein/PAS domain S-box-containing protein
MDQGYPLHYLRAAFVSSPDAIVGVDASLVVRHANPAATQLYGRPVDELIGRPVTDLAPDELRGEQIDMYQRALRGESTTIPETIRIAHGRQVHVSISTSPVRDDGVVVGAASIVRDISAIVVERNRLQRLRSRQDEAEVFAGVGSLEIDLATLTLEASVGMARMHLGNPDNPAPTWDDVAQFVDPADRDHVLAAILDTSDAVVEYHYVEDPANPRLMQATGRWLPSPEAGHPGYRVAIVRDITEERAREMQLRFLADHDPLTGVLNRRAFERALHRHAANVQRGRLDPCGALLSIDLDEFKYHNDTYGHAVGDAILVAVATHLQERLRAGDEVGRPGGDEFAVLLPDVTPEEADRVAASLLACIVEAAHAISPDEQHPLTASIGVADFAADVSVEQIQLAADAAMYRAKDNGRNRWSR